MAKYKIMRRNADEHCAKSRHHNGKSVVMFV